MIIGVDIDDTLADFSSAFIEFCRIHYGVEKKKQDFTHTNFLSVWGVPIKEIQKRLQEFDQQSLVNLSPMTGAEEMIKRLSKKYELHAITHRTPSIFPNTRSWISRHFPDAFAGIHIGGREDGLSAYPKSAVCKKLGINIILEDHPQNARQCAEDGIHVYLFNQPWNQHEEFPLLAGAIFRVAGWRDQLLETLLL